MKGYVIIGLIGLFLELTFGGDWSIFVAFVLVVGGVYWGIRNSTSEVGDADYASAFADELLYNKNATYSDARKAGNIAKQTALLEEIAKQNRK